METMCKDLAAEQAALDVLVKDLDEKAWQAQTPLDDWTIKDVIAHLTYFDSTAHMAATDPQAFKKHLEKIMAGFSDFDRVLTDINAEFNHLTGAELLARWREGRKKLLDVFSALSPKERLIWYGPPMGPKSMLTGRLMETWAHGQDVADTLKIRYKNTDRLKHVAHIGVSTFAFCFKNRQMEVPDKKVRVELTGPGGDLWTWGPEDSNDIVRGPAEDFCLLVTKRRHLDDVNLEVTGEVAKLWISIAQAFAGPPEEGPQPGERVW